MRRFDNAFVWTVLYLAVLAVPVIFG